jgi:hypothetical protein
MKLVAALVIHVLMCTTIASTGFCGIALSRHVSETGSLDGRGSSGCIDMRTGLPPLPCRNDFGPR